MPDINVYDSVTVQDYTDVSEFYVIDVSDSVSISDWIDQFRRFAAMVERWLLPVRERLLFNTEILRSHNRTEQRIAKRRGIPERNLSGRVLLDTDADFSRFETLLHGWLKRTWAVPLWPLAEYTTDSITAEQSTISIDTTYSGYVVGGFALIWQDKNTYDLVVISSLTDSSLGLSVTPSNSYSGTTFVMPIRTGRCVSISRLKRYHGMSYVDMVFRIEEVEDVIDYSPGMTYDGYTVLDDPAKFSRDGAEYSYNPDMVLLDAGTGPFEVVSNSTYNLTIQPHRWICETKQAAWELRQFFYHTKGRQKGFLVPTFGYDLELSQDVGAADTSIYVVNQNYMANMGLNDKRTYIAFRPSGADIIVRKITDIVVLSESEEILTIDAAPGDTFSSGDYLCWVDLCRLASDDITMNWYERGKYFVETDLLRITEYSEAVLEASGYSEIDMSDDADSILDLGTYDSENITVTDERTVQVI